MAVGTSRPSEAHTAPPCPPAGEPPGIDPDDLPDGRVGADETGRVICFNAAAARITATPSAQALGRPLELALPLEDLKGRRWWPLTDPYGGLATPRPPAAAPSQRTSHCPLPLPPSTPPPRANTCSRTTTCKIYIYL